LGLRSLCGGLGSGLRRCGLSRCCLCGGHITDTFMLFQHGIQNAIGNSLLLQINDFLRAQGVNGAGIMDKIDDDVFADLCLGQFQYVLDAIGQLGRCSDGE